MKLKSLFKQYGLSAFPRIFKAVLRKTGITIESFYLLKYTVIESAINEKLINYNYSDVKEITKNDVQKINFINEEKSKLFIDRFNEGNYSCYAIMVAEEIQYLTWISWKHMNYPSIFNKQDELKPNQALLEDSFCSPNHRGKGYHSKMNMFRLKKISEKGKTEVLALVLMENKPAIKVQLKSGFNYYSRIRFFKIGNWSKIVQKLLK